MGSAEFGIPALEHLRKSEQVVGIVTTPAKPKGRGLKMCHSPVYEYAEKEGVHPLMTPSDLKTAEFTDQLKALDADLFVVVAYRILPREVFSIPRLGTVNIHASLLPKYRGAAPIHRAIEAGERETGVTVFRINEGIDAGEILIQKKIGIKPQECTPDLYQRLTHLGAEGLMEAIDGIKSGNLKPQKQDEEKITRAPKLRREEAFVDWNLSAEQIYNKIRAFKPFPGTCTNLQGKRLGIEWAQVTDCREGSEPGSVVEIGKDYFSVKCARGCLKILEVKPEGRKKMSVEAFLLGNRLTEGSKLQ
ncbi:Methionyl-tRNA formyltransferase [Chitinispirillum alkaliphilum]|nr:Methionyl-tRNA formyltransferase [Chitinispirillum alkaliphilum]